MSDRSSAIARLLFLGGQRLEIGNDVVTPDAERLFAMVVRLSVPLGRLVSRQTMLETLWPGADEMNGRHNLRQTVYKARELGLVVESGEDGLRLDPRHWSCDWEDPTGDVPGEWLPNYAPEFSDDLRAWVASQRFGVHAGLRPRLMRSLQRARAAGELPTADGYARQLLAFDPLNEEATMVRAELLAMQGSKVDALRLLDAYEREMGQLSAGKDAALPVQLLRRRIAEKLPRLSYVTGDQSQGRIIGRADEVRHLFASVIEARAGRGTGTFLFGPPGSGKSRLLDEARKIAVLQGVRVVELTCTPAHAASRYAAARQLVQALVQMPGALGTSPASLATITRWLATTDETTDAPSADIDDLLAAVADDAPVALLVDNGEAMDAASIALLQHAYRPAVPRFHMLVFAAGLPLIATDVARRAPGMAVLRLAPLSTAEVREILGVTRAASVARASENALTCAALFAEGVPMFGIEMLGLILDVGSPDEVPWRVRNAVDQLLACLSDLQARLLHLCGRLEGVATQDLLLQALHVDEADLLTAVHGLELVGAIRVEDGHLVASKLHAMAAAHHIRPVDARNDASRAALYITTRWPSHGPTRAFYIAVRLFMIARQESLATRFIDRMAGTLVRLESAQELLFELRQLRKDARDTELSQMLDLTLGQIAVGALNQKEIRKSGQSAQGPSSLPALPESSAEMEYSFCSDEAFNLAFSRARDPRTSPAQRASEAVLALAIASNAGDRRMLNVAYEALNTVRHCNDTALFDVRRADLIYSATIGDRRQAIHDAQLLAAACRDISDIQLVCKGLRNAAEALACFGEQAQAQALLLDARETAARLEYTKQVAVADIRLADMAIERMDIDGAKRHLQFAFEAMELHSSFVPLFGIDLHVFSCWLAVLQGDVASASKAARAVARRVQRVAPLTGMAQWTTLAVKLAAHQGGDNAALRQATAELKESVASREYYPNEQYCLASILLSERRHGRANESKDFVRAQLPRLQSKGRAVWPFLVTLLN